MDLSPLHGGTGEPGAPWHGFIPEHELEIYRAAGFGTSTGLGRRPALLVIDMQYRSLGYQPKPILSAIADFATCCGEYGWQAVPHVQKLLKIFRARKLPVIFPHVAPKGKHGGSRFTDKAPRVLGVPLNGYDFVAEVAPVEDELLIPKFHASAFFGTALTSHLIDLGIDSLVVSGCTTSGCVRATVVDACSLGYRVVVPHEGVYDRSQVSHAVNLFDMAQKYADVMSAQETVSLIESMTPADAVI